MESSWQRLMTATGKVWRLRRNGTQYLSYCSGYKTYSFSKSTKEIELFALSLGTFTSTQYNA